MALRASATARLPLHRPSSATPPPPRTTTTTTASFSPVKSPPGGGGGGRGPQLRHDSSSSVLLPTTTAVSLLTLFAAAPNEAKALTLSKEQIVSSLTQVEETVGQVQEVGSNVLDIAGKVFQTVIDTVKPGVDVAMPILKQAGGEAVKIASPAMTEVSKKAQEAMQSSGLDTEPVFSAAKTVADAAQQTTSVIEGAKPLALSTVEAISSSPTTIAATGGALFLAYLLFPPVLSAISFNLRGYKGDLSPAQTLDLVSSTNYVLIDIRSEKDKDKAGVPRLPSSAKNKMIAIPLEELPSKLKSLVRNTKKVEAEIAALKISYLKKVNKGSNIVIMDTYTDSAKTVAKTLTSLGFKNCWIMADGFSGGKGWLQSRLGTDSYNLSFAQVISPSRIIPAAVRGFGTTSSTKLLQ